MKKTWILPGYTICVDKRHVHVNGQNIAATYFNRNLYFALGADQYIITNGPAIKFDFDKQLYKNTINVETGECFVESNHVLFLVIAFIFGFMFGLFILVPLLIYILVLYIVYKDAVVDLTNHGATPSTPLAQQTYV